MTAEELFALPDDDRIDRRLIRGRLVERPYPFRCPAHARVTATLSWLVGGWRRSPDGTGWGVHGYGCPYRLGRSPDTLLYFDTSVVPASLDATVPADRQFVEGQPTVAIEVLDLSDPGDAVGELIDVAVTAGIKLLWFVDPFEETVEVHRPGHRRVVLRGGDELTADMVGPTLRFPVSLLFE